MKTVAAVVLVALMASPAWLLPSTAENSDVLRFDSAGMQIGQETVSGAVLQLRTLAKTAVLVSGSVLEPLSDEVELSVAAGRTLRLSPGLRVERMENGYQIRTHGNGTILLQGSEGSILLPSPTLFRVTEEGWDFDGQKMSGETVVAGMSAKGEVLAAPDQERRRPRSQAGRAGRGARGPVRRIFSENPAVTSEAVCPVAVQSVQNVSPFGQ